MSRNVLNCRQCRAPIVVTHDSGQIDFLARMTKRTADGRFWLVCACGAARDWTLPKEVAAIR
jgi:hypothetical protein